MAELKVTATPNTQNIDCVVTLKAPLEKVYKAYSTKESVAQWWAQGNPPEIDYYDAVSGGKWRFIEHGEDGNDYAFHGCFHEIKPNERIIQTFEFEGLPESGHVALERADFIAKSDTETEVRITSTFQSVEDRDGMIASGMESGMRKSVEALGRLVEE